MCWQKQRKSGLALQWRKSSAPTCSQRLRQALLTRKTGIYEFFGKTFYAYQFDVKAIKSVIDKILRFLHDEEMILVVGDHILATKFGKRISELYIDPLSGVIIRDALQSKPPILTEFSLLHLVSHTPDMGPIMRPYQREMEQSSSSN